MRHPFLSPCLVAAILAPALSAQLPEDRATGAATINEAELEKWLTRLSSKEFAGRGTGQPGFALAAEMVENHFRELELEPAQGNRHRIQVPWLIARTHRENTYLEFQREDEQLSKFRVADGLKVRANADSEVSGDLVLVAFDGDVSKITELELIEKDVVIGFSTENLNRTRVYYNLRRAVREAGGRLIALADPHLVNNLPTDGATMPGGKGQRTARSRRRRPPEIAVDRKIAQSILDAVGISVDDIAKAGMIRVPGVRATAKVEIETSDAPAWNIAGVLRGSDETLREEYVVVGCHLDHLGKRGATIYPGADDDGSGSVALMAVAQAFAKNEITPKRSVLFVAFCGEENGLVGSAHFAKNCPVPLENIVGELQLDMVGRSEERRPMNERADQNRNSLHLIGTEKLSVDLHDLCIRLNQERARFDLEWDQEDVFYRSDHWNFARYGVPVAFFFTGFHPDYHKPTDTVDKIEFPKLARVTRYVYDIAFELAQADQRPLVDPERWEKLQRKGRKTPAAPMRESK